MKMEKKDPLYRSFGYAFQGIFTCVRKERNMKIHCAAVVCVVIACCDCGCDFEDFSD